NPSKGAGATVSRRSRWSAERTGMILGVRRNRQSQWQNMLGTSPACITIGRGLELRRCPAHRPRCSVAGRIIGVLIVHRPPSTLGGAFAGVGDPYFSSEFFQPVEIRLPMGYAHSIAIRCATAALAVPTAAAVSPPIAEVPA